MEFVLFVFWKPRTQLRFRWDPMRGKTLITVGFTGQFSLISCTNNTKLIRTSDNITTRNPHITNCSNHSTLQKAPLIHRHEHQTQQTRDTNRTVPSALIWSVHCNILPLKRKTFNRILFLSFFLLISICYNNFNQHFNPSEDRMSGTIYDIQYTWRCYVESGTMLQNRKVEGSVPDEWFLNLPNPSGGTRPWV
jgi:hypothetical protein